MEPQDGSIKMARWRTRARLPLLVVVVAIALGAAVILWRFGRDAARLVLASPKPFRLVICV